MYTPTNPVDRAVPVDQEIPVDRVVPVDQEVPVDQTAESIAATASAAETEGQGKVSVEEFTINGDALTAKVKELIHQGNIRRIIIKNEEGRILIEIPLTVGVVGGVLSAALFPVVAAVGVIGAMVAHLTIVIEKHGD